MSVMIIDPLEWVLPAPEAALAVFDPKKSGQKRRETWILPHSISAVDLYSYLKHRFGEPNGFAMALRSPSVDNLIHWNYTLASGTAILDIRGLDLRNELTAILPPDAEAPDWSKLEGLLLKEFQAKRAGMAEVCRTFERWRLFVNPHEVLRVKLERQVKRLRELDIRNVDLPKDPRSAEDARAFPEKLSKCQAVFQEAMTLCVDIQLSAPVFAESAVNLLLLLLAKPEVRADKRMFEDQCRRNLDVRVKGLHLVCEGFAGRVDGSEEPFKEFLRMVNRRNDRLHGNVDPAKSKGHEVYFDHRFIPLFTQAQGFTQLALEHALADVDPDAAIRDWDAARGLVDLLLSKLDGRVRRGIEGALKQQQLGYRADTGIIGVILPQVRVDIFPAGGSGSAGGYTA